MRKETAFTIFIGAIMLMSVAGYASFSLRFNNPQEQQQVTIPTIINRSLTGYEKSLILNRGGIILEYFYSNNCTDCKLNDATLRAFANKYSSYLVYESVESDVEKKLQIIGRGGRITKIENVTQDALLELFCQESVVKPRECLLKEYELTLNTT